MMVRTKTALLELGSVCELPWLPGLPLELPVSLMAVYSLSLCKETQWNSEKLDGVAPLIADPFRCNSSNTLWGRNGSSGSSNFCVIEIG